MKKIYFVRHGESEGNAGGVYQGHFSSLNDKGKQQADFLARRCSRLNIDCVISSTMDRARETTAIIIQNIEKPVEYSDLFVERRRPSVQIGRAKNDPLCLEADKIIIDNFGKPGFRHSDEENFDDLNNRATKALEYLATRPENEMLVVTHGFFLRIIAARAVFENSLTGNIAEYFIRKFQTVNSGISVLGYDENKPRFPWHLLVWNDHAHLSDIR